MKYFEFACSRNEGRSPAAELIAQWYLEQKGLSSEYGAISSGSHRFTPDTSEVQSMSSGELPFELMVSLIEMGLEHHIFPDSEEMAVRQALASKDASQLSPFYKTANKIFKDQERYFRADAVHHLAEDKGLKGYLKAHSDQTVPRDDVVAIFAMAHNNTNQIRHIYKDVPRKPLIETLSAYVTGDPEAQLPNAFAKGEAFYHHVVAQLWEQIPLAIDKFLKSADHK